MSSMGEGRVPQSNRRGSELWTDGLICAFEFVRGQQKIGWEKSHFNVSSHAESDNGNSKMGVHAYGGHEVTVRKTNRDSLLDSSPLIQLENQKIAPSDDKVDRQCSQLDQIHGVERVVGSHWVPIGWTRISELVQKFQVDSAWSEHRFDLMDDEDDLTVADLAAPYWERPAGPIWWCHVAAGHPFVNSWLNSAQWLHPAISIALRDESRLISEKMEHLLYEVPVRVAGGLLFELLGQSAGDPYDDEDDIPIVLRSFQAQNFLITVLHMKGSAKSINVLGITEVQELLCAGGYNMPRTVHEVIAHLASRLARWDDSI